MLGFTSSRPKGTLTVGERGVHLKLCEEPVPRVSRTAWPAISADSFLRQNHAQTEKKKSPVQKSSHILVKFSNAGGEWLKRGLF